MTNTRRYFLAGVLFGLLPMVVSFNIARAVSNDIAVCRYCRDAMPRTDLEYHIERLVAPGGIKVLTCRRAMNQLFADKAACTLLREGDEEPDPSKSN